MTVVDGVQLQLHSGVSKVEFLIQSTVFVNVFCILLPHVLLTAINGVCDHGAQVLQAAHPGKRVPTEVHIREGSWLGQKSHAFCLALDWVWISGELEIV